MSDAVFVREFDEQLLTLAAAVSDFEVWQAPSGEAAVYNSREAASSGDRAQFLTRGKFTMPKTTGVVFLPGIRAYWDHSANKVHFKKVNDRDFYLGRIVEDATSAAITCVVDLNADPPYDLDLSRDPFTTTIVGTQALGGLALLRRGGAHHIVLSSTNEAQKVDMLGVDGFAKGANAIVEMAFRVVSDGAGSAVDVSIGIANASHATDADLITESVFVHLDANDVDINLESDDGTTEVAATDTTVNYTEGSTVSCRVEVWFDMRDPADIQCYVDGVLVLNATVFNVDAAVGPFVPLVHVEKTASTDTYELAIDWHRTHYSEQ